MRFYCTNCSAEFLKWEGRCSSCGEWDSLAEMEQSSSRSERVKPASTVSMKDLEKESGAKERLSTSIGELDRVLGGGLVGGSVSLVAGQPGIGKSTLLLQSAIKLASKGTVLYVSGEESAYQLRTRLDRVVEGKLSVKEKENLVITEETNVAAISELIRELKPIVAYVDSIQSMSSDAVKSFAGSIGQVRVCGSLLTKLAKETDVPLVMVGQINKEGSIAGPKVLEHVVDVVLNVEGGEYDAFRIVRSVKNRFGSTNEIGVFEMSSAGMSEVSNPSEIFLGSSKGGSGSAVGAILKGSRVVFVEVQALVLERGMEGGPLRRVANGVKKTRLDMLCAVLTKRGNAFLGDKDVFVNLVGGITVDDPALDLAICAAIKSSMKDKALSNKAVYWGEIGLTGDVLGGYSLKTVLKEARRVGYKEAYVSGKNSSYQGFKTIAVGSISKI